MGRTSTEFVYRNNSSDEESFEHVNKTVIINNLPSQKRVRSTVSDVDINRPVGSQRRFLNWNVEGLLGKLAEIDFINYVNDFDIVCFTETFLEFESNLDCFGDFIQYFSPAIKLSDNARSSGGVLLMVKRNLKPLVKEADMPRTDNMVWIKLDKSLFQSDRDVLMCAVYVCPYGSAYYRQEHVNVSSTIYTLEQLLLDSIEEHGDSLLYLVSGDMNGRCGTLNVASHDNDDDDVSAFVQSDLYDTRKSEDTTVNAFGKLLLDMCAACDLTIVNGNCRGDKNGCFTYVCYAGCSTIDYFLCSRELLSGDMHLKVAERFESKHLPVEFTLFPRDNRHIETKLTKLEKLVWDQDKKALFMDEINSSKFQEVLSRAISLVRVSIDDSIECLRKGLVDAAACMKRMIYTGPKQSSWYDTECKMAKRTMRKWFRKFNRTKNAVLRRESQLLYVECRRSYRVLLKGKRKQYKEDKLRNLMSKINDSKLFWREARSINGKSHRQPPNISDNEWLEHFRGVLGSNKGDNLEVERGCENATDNYVDALDRPITSEEISNAIKHLKSNKSAGLDGILAEMLKCSSSRILPLLEQLFNAIFDTGQYPEVWTQAVIIPIHKAGSKDNPDNYRGVSLLSILGKVFAHILNKRLTLWAEEHGKISEEQSGFRSGYSTADNIFVLYAIVQRYLLKKSGKVYVCFVDFKKAFDTVDRAVLWNVLRNYGVDGKMLKMLQSMYKRVQSCVRGSCTVSDFFESTSGVRQGCVMSPTLFSFLINELANDVLEHGDHGIQLTPDVVQILILLFADDVTLTSYCPSGLQRQIDILKRFADNFNMTVNLTKTKIIVFRKGGFLKRSESWKYGNEKIEVVNGYKYLGLHFTTKMSLVKMVGELASKAKSKTSHLLKCLWKLGQIPSELFFKMYDAQVLPVLMYGAEIWGFQRFDQLEKAHLFACKRFLNVGWHTPNKMVYGDLGRYPMYVISATRCLKYWFRVVNLPESRLPKKAYSMLLHLQNQGKKNWAYQVKLLLCQNGFNDVWTQQSVGDLRVFLNLFKKRLFDAFQGEWHASISTSDRFELYSSFKANFVTERYFDYAQLRCYREAYVRFRFGISPIFVHKLRYKSNIVPRNLLCPVCKTEIESEEHILLVCSEYREMRKDVCWFSGNCNQDISQIMSRDDELSVLQLSKFLYRVFSRRTEFLKQEEAQICI